MTDEYQNGAEQTAMSKAVKMWLDYLLHNKGRSRATAYKYDNYLFRLEKLLADKDRDHLSATRDDLVEFCGMHLFKSGCAPRSRTVAVAGIKGFFGWLHRFGIRADDPSKLLEYPKSVCKLPNFPTIQQAEKLLLAPDLNTFTGVRDAAIIAMFIGCGLRISGVANLNESNLIFYLDEKGRERLRVKVTEKGKKERIVPAPDEVLLFVRAYLGHPELANIERTLSNGDKVLFVHSGNKRILPCDDYGENRRMSVRSIQSMIEEHGKKAGLPRDLCHAHALRHLYGTELAEENSSVLDMQALLGHAKADTVGIYAHVAMRKLTDVVDKGNPLRKMQTPVSPLLARARRQ